MSIGYVLDEGDSLQEKKGYVPREKQRSLVEVHVSGICFRNHGGGHYSILLCKRRDDRELYPGKWEGCGGQLLPGEKFHDGVVRHYREDLGLKVGVTGTLTGFSRRFVKVLRKGSLLRLTSYILNGKNWLIID